MAQDEKVVAIGECGLNYYRLEEHTKALQRKVFKQHIQLAHHVKKLLMIHCRNAFDDLIDTLVANRLTLNALPGIVHFFTGSVDDTKKLLDLGFFFIWRRDYICA